MVILNVTVTVTNKVGILPVKLNINNMSKHKRFGH